MQKPSYPPPRPRDSVEVFNEMGNKVSVDVLRKYDLLVVYWKEPRVGSIDIFLGRYASLMEFHGVDAHGIIGRFHHDFRCSNPLYYSLDCVAKIHIAGRDKTGRTMSFVNTLFDERVRAERAYQKMRDNIDALKA